MGGSVKGTGLLGDWEKDGEGCALLIRVLCLPIAFLTGSDY
jgi:hypothetical protein